jgi:hypothetical protein
LLPVQVKKIFVIPHWTDICRQVCIPQQQALMEFETKIIERQTSA